MTLRLRFALHGRFALIVTDGGLLPLPLPHTPCTFSVASLDDCALVEHTRTLLLFWCAHNCAHACAGVLLVEFYRHTTALVRAVCCT